MAITSVKNILLKTLNITTDNAGTSVYATVRDVPNGTTPGENAYVTATNKLYIWTGTAWYNIALVNTAPTITQGANATYDLATDGTPTEITLIATDPEGFPITWSYSVTSGSLTNGGGATATVTQNGNEVTITPTTTEDYAGEFELTFTASDGVNTDTSVSSFSLIFGLRGVLIYTLDNPTAYSTGSYDNFGFAVSISESYAIVGAYWEDDAGGLDSGKAYIYSNATGQLLHTLDNPNAYDTSAGDSFGYSVAISESYAIVGALGEDDAGGTGSGKAYIFDNATGQLLYTLDNPNAYGTSTLDRFVWSVSISESYAIVGAWGEDDAGDNDSGKAYIYSTTTGQLLYTLDNPTPYGTSSYDNFGWSVSISESYAIVGAYTEDDAGGTGSGKAYIYSTSTGQLLYTLDNPNAYSTSTSDLFGSSVSISESYAIVSAKREDDAGGSDSGKAYIYSTATGQLLHTLDNPNAYDTSVEDNFGQSVSISESYAIVGAYYEDDAGGTYSGKAYIFDNATGQLLYTLDNPTPYGTSAGDNFGQSVSISESYAIVGAYQEDDASGSQSGKAYIYK